IIISVIVLSILLSVLYTDIEWGVNSPIGLILKSSVDEKGQIKLNSLGQPLGDQWTINVGGTQRDNYSEGIQIPVYVAVFGIIGGYLRHLYDVTKYVQVRKELDEQVDKEISELPPIEISGLPPANLSS